MKRLIDYFRNPKQSSAALAKERLQIIIAHERNGSGRDDLLATLQQELVAVIAKHLKLDPAAVKEQVKLDVAKEGEHSILELNITLPALEAATA
jgi:cell division topological specificity factor